jgi:NifU-like protein involved in Fe-S cluster formation/bacterioferritin-associated ferredoxin
LSFCMLPSKPVQLISWMGLVGRACASFSGTSLTETGLFPTATGAAAGRQPSIKTIEINNNKNRTGVIGIILHDIGPEPFAAAGLYRDKFYLMPFYPENIDQRSRRPEHSGRAKGANGIGTSASFECGSFARVSLVVDDRAGKITDAKFESNGCGFMTAAADRVAEVLIGRKLTDLHSVDEEYFVGQIESDLGVFPLERKQCRRVLLEAVRAALADHRAFLIEEFRGERALICTCFGVSEDTIESYIAANYPETVDEVTAATRAGGGCGSCRMIIQEMIDERRMEQGV